MNKLLPLLALCLAIAPNSFSQDELGFDREFAPVEQELAQWDPIRGKWLGASLKAMAKGEQIPDRTFPEDMTPGEMIEGMPKSQVDKIRALANTQANAAGRAAGTSPNRTTSAEWNRVQDYLSRRGCEPVLGRSYGDPHMRSFDGQSYSFQTVGEFTMVESTNNQFDIQVRQEASGEDFSLNTAAAMKVGGDRVAIYANGVPDMFTQTPLRVNGFPLELDNETYFLPHGGTIKKSGRNYLVTWPTGETASFDMRRSGRMGFLNIGVQVYPCSQFSYNGLLGNANGNRRDDFDTRAGTVSSEILFPTGSSDMQKRRLAFLAKEFANDWRIAQHESMFDYKLGENTLTYTDRSFPRVHRTLADLPNDRRNTSARLCRERGFTGPELEACMFDNGFLNIPPTRVPNCPPPRRNVAFKPVIKEVPNVNTRKPIPPRTPVGSGSTGSTGGTRTFGTATKDVQLRTSTTGSTKKNWTPVEGEGAGPSRVNNGSNGGGGALPRTGPNTPVQTKENGRTRTTVGTSQDTRNTPSTRTPNSTRQGTSRQTKAPSNVGGASTPRSTPNTRSNQRNHGSGMTKVGVPRPPTRSTVPSRPKPKPVSKPVSKPSVKPAAKPAPKPSVKSSGLKRGGI